LLFLIFKDQIKAKITAAINKKVDAKVSFEDADFFESVKNFPNAISITLAQEIDFVY
jgi:hypothetical protein